MADDTLEWLFKLTADVSGATVANVALVQMDSAIKKVTEDTEKLEGAHKKGGKEGERWKENLRDIYKRYIEFEIVKEVTEKIYDLGKEFAEAALEAADFDARTGVAFKNLTGSAKMAEEVMDSARQFSMKAALPVDDVMKNYQTLLMAKIQPIDIPVVLQGASDLSALGGGRVSVDELTEAFAKMSNEGKLTSASLRELRASGLDLEALAKRLGEKSVGDLTKNLEKNPVDAATGLQAIMETIASKEGGVLGSTTVDMADTFGGTIQKIKNGWEIMLGEFGKSPEFSGIRGALKDIGTWFDPSTEKGKEFEETLGKVLSIAGNLVDNVLSALPALFDALTDQSAPFFENFKSFWSDGNDKTDLSGVFTQVGKAILAAADDVQILIAFYMDIVDIGNAIANVFRTVIDTGEKVWRLAQVGKNLLMHGQLVDNEQLEDDAVASGTVVGKGIETGAKDALEIHSPSRVFAEMGGQASDGFSDGFDHQVLETPTMSKPVDRGGDDDGRGGGHGPVTVNAPFHVEIQGHADDETMKRLEEKQAGHLASMLEQLSEELGSA